eukprot:1288810-Amphidinium_carterae.1
MMYVSGGPNLPKEAAGSAEVAAHRARRLPCTDCPKRTTECQSASLSQRLAQFLQVDFGCCEPSETPLQAC